MWKPATAVEWIILLLILAITGGAVFVAIAEERDWDQFRVSHSCRVVGKTSSTTSSGWAFGGKGGGGPVVTTEPGKTGWLCNDGVTYWR